MMDALRRFWKARAPRERIILAAGAALLLAAFAYAYLWRPVERSRVRLEASLPSLRIQLRDMRAEAAEAAALKRAPKVKAAPIDSALREAGTVSGLEGSALQVETIDASRARVTMSAVAFDRWLQWVAALQAQHGVRVESCRVVGLPQPGMVRAETTLVRG